MGLKTFFNCMKPANYVPLKFNIKLLIGSCCGFSLYEDCKTDNPNKKALKRIFYMFNI